MALRLMCHVEHLGWFCIGVGHPENEMKRCHRVADTLREVAQGRLDTVFSKKANASGRRSSRDKESSVTLKHSGGPCLG